MTLTFAHVPPLLWFLCISCCAEPLERSNIIIEFTPVRLRNELQKPGPVFLEIAKKAYQEGADYFYRLNDDTQLVGRWPSIYVQALQVREPTAASACRVTHWRLTCCAVLCWLHIGSRSGSRTEWLGPSAAKEIRRSLRTTSRTGRTWRSLTCSTTRQS